MRVLFVPLPSIGHTVPLIALSRTLSSQVECAFLLPWTYHSAAKRAGLPVLPLPNQGPGKALEISSHFQPDVIVKDGIPDCSMERALGCPSVAILRASSCPGYLPRHPEHRHSMMGCETPMILNEDQVMTRASATEPQIDTGDGFIVPGIRTIEVLPAKLQKDPRFIFSGPLILPDELSAKLLIHEPPAENSVKLEVFLEANWHRRKVMVTTGTVLPPSNGLEEAVQGLLAEGVAVVATFPLKSTLPPKYRDLFFYASYLPMHQVSKQADVIVHHCGSGTYHFPLLYGRSAVTIGSNCFDRDDIGERLQELKVSRHIAESGERQSFARRIVQSVASSIETPPEPSNMRAVQDEIERTRDAFHFEGILSRLCSATYSRPYCASESQGA
jgi:hypothetical protein